MAVLPQDIARYKPKPKEAGDAVGVAMMKDVKVY